MGVDIARSFWLRSAKRPSAPKCERPEVVDVAIVGGGIVGIVTAYELAKQGRRPVLFERNRLLGSVTGHTTAKVTSQHGIRYHRIRENHGDEKARAYADANQAAIDWLFQTCAAESIECGLERDFACTYTEDPDATEKFDQEREACSELGLPLATETLATSVPVAFKHEVTFTGQARFHPVEFLSALVERAQSLGAVFYEDSPATEIEEKDGGVSFLCNNHRVEAQEVVVATHYPVYDSGFFIAKLAPYRSYAMAIEVTSGAKNGMFISDADELHSWRPHGENVMIVGAGCHKVGQEPDTEGEYQKLRDWALMAFGPNRVLAEWSAQDNATHDELPYVGSSPGTEHIFVATGFDGWGMTNGIASARLITALVTGEDHPLKEALEPGRLSLKGFAKLASENLDAVGHLTTDRFRRVRAGVPEDLKPGEAGVFSGGVVERIAAYRDDHGVLHEMDATCPHFKCQVEWNPAERTWDCPCHGSRFSATGDVVQAPALGGLSPIKAEAKKKG